MLLMMFEQFITLYFILYQLQLIQEFVVKVYH